MIRIVTLLTFLLMTFSASAFEMGSYASDETSGCWIELFPNATSIKADGSCYTAQGMSYNILGLVRTNYGLYEYTFEMGDELFINKIIVSKELISFKIYNIETKALVQDESLKFINATQVQYYLSYFDYLGNPDVRFDITLDKQD